MASSTRRSPRLFFRDIASPSSKFSTPGRPSSLLYHQHQPSPSDLPPPPSFTLDDRADFSPDAPPGELPPPPSPHNLSPSPDLRTPSRRPPARDPAAEATPSPTATPNWWSPVRDDDRGKGSPVDGVVEPRALVVLPPPREAVRPELKERTPPAVVEGDEWVTVYGFSPADTNLVLREFEKCGPILQHVLGPRDANWMHILYQNKYDAQKALQKNGVQINSVLIVGVKRVDPMQRQFLNEKLSNTNKGFMVSLPPPLTNGRSTTASSTVKPSSYVLRPNDGSINDGVGRMDGAIATPAKSVFSKAIDLMFGL